ncbi:MULTISPECIES: ATP-binding protein [unclassified Coleofasciculus]|uniref:sensor histidine kinase n=1 Tax=Cyanophyceae TaxID=3028117 RepID=UPI0016892A3B|nr:MULTISPECIES: ATP-binding protein [unclassified Coleofasciculus]MBD1878985.1 PAS domain S-box protein [Coleofasciculus sp. FACHB-T130]MBD2541832.1 PAS domain S-box protein [Coleofasciculus sp. FACHB-SPT36]
MMNQPLRVLIVEDLEDDAELLLNELEHGGYEPIYERVDTAAAMNTALDKQHWDIVISDYSMPTFSAPAALTLLKDKGLDLPFIIVSGNIGEDVAVAAMKAGASDYLMKGKLARLIPAVERELREAVERRKRREAEQALRENDERFRLLIENALDIIAVLDTDGTIYYTSPSVEKVLGYEPEELVSKNLYDFIHPENVVRVIQTLNQAVENPNITLSIEFKVLHQNGFWQILEAICKNFIPHSGIPRIVVNCRDITERNRAEEVRIALEKEKELNEGKFYFVSMMAHEFRNPLNTILMSAELLEHYNYKATEEQKALYFNRIRSAAKQMTQLLEDVLTISRAEVGELEINIEPFELKQFCHDLMEEIQFTTEKEHTLIFVSKCKCAQVCMDQKLLWHILTNLVSNAIKYSPQGGTVQLELSCHDGQATIQIKDEGIGIPPTDQEQLFEVFHRAKNVGKIPGTGLGLSIVKKFVDLHGGQISVSSEVGVGTTFTVLLPLNSQMSTEELDDATAYFAN